MKVSKPELANAILKTSSLFVYLYGKSLGALLPHHLRLQDQVVLQFGYDMAVPIPDLEVNDFEIIGTLSFGGVPYKCYIPWEAVYALVNEDSKGMVWNENMPESVKEAMGKMSNKTLPEHQPSPKLKLMHSSTAQKKTKAKPGHLRLVK